MSLITAETTIEELAALICQRLHDAKIETFLSGGAVVSIYTHNQFESYDLDFVSYGDRKAIKQVMLSLGFTQDSSRFFVHPHNQYFVEFPGKSFEVGDEPIHEFEKRVTNGNTLVLLTPTDCVKDRLAAYLHWNDRQSLDQSILVALHQPVSVTKIKLFCSKEGRPEVFQEWSQKLGNALKSQK